MSKFKQWLFWKLIDGIPLKDIELYVGTRRVREQVTYNFAKLGRRMAELWLATAENPPEEGK